MPQDVTGDTSDNPSDEDKPQQEENDKKAALKTTTEAEQADVNTVVKKLTGDNKGTSEFKNQFLLCNFIQYFFVV